MKLSLRPALEASGGAVDLRSAAVGAAAPLAVLGLYHLVLRPWHLSFGARDDEAAAVLPGDDLLPAPSVVSTRAIGIDATAEQVWPWLVQLGKDRGGLYSYTKLENLFGFGIHNADRIVPELQDLAVGDCVPLSKNRFSIMVREIDAPRSLVFEFTDGGWVWTFHVAESENGGSRLICATVGPRRGAAAHARLRSGRSNRPPSSWSSGCCAASSNGPRALRASPRHKPCPQAVDIE